MRDVVPPSRVFAALVRRDLRVVRRELPFFLVRTMLQPLFFVIVFGFLLPKMGFMKAGYTAALLPGILALSITLSSIQSVTLPMVQDFGWTKEIEDRLLAPIPTSLVAIEKMAMGTLQGMIVAVVLMPLARLIMGPIPGLTLSHLGVVFVLAILGGAAFSALGLWMGSRIEPTQIGLMFSVIIAPMLFFGCVYYPWVGLSVVPVLQYLVLLNPLVYVAEGMRGALIPGMPHLPLTYVLLGLVVITALMMFFAMRAFEKRAIG